jgi:hypothetical protein
MAFNILQITLGLLTLPPCFFMLIEKEHTSSGGGLIDFIPQNSVFEFVLLFIGLSVIICGFLQLKAHTKYASIQILLGLIITAISAPVAIKLYLTAVFDVPTLHLLALILLACGFGVISIGLIQLKSCLNRSEEQNRLSESTVAVRDYTGCQRLGKGDSE